MGTITMANSAAAALLSLQMMSTTTMAQGLKRRVLRAAEPAEESPAALSSGGGGGGERESMCELLLPEDVLAQCFLHLDSFQDMASANRVCQRWREAMRQALACRAKLSFAGWRADDMAVARLVEGASSLRELNISNGRWGCRITDVGLFQISLAKCCPNLTSVSLWGVTAITDNGVVQLVTRAQALEHFNVGGTFITDVSMLAIATHCSLLKCINLWCCRHVTEAGLLALVRGCPKLHSINVWGMSISRSCEVRLKRINANLHLKPLAHQAE